MIEQKANSSFPMWERINLDIQSSCNRDCDFCPRYYDRSKIRKDRFGNKIRKEMPSEMIYSIIDQVNTLGFTGDIAFHRLSEPMLDPRYIDFAQYAKEKGLSVREHTNGDYLKKNVKLCNKIDGLVDELVVGLYDYKTYEEKIREQEFWVNRFKKTRIGFSTPVEFPKIRQGSKIYYNTKKDKNILDLPCFRGDNLLLIRYDGEVSLCCHDDEGAFKLGNVFHKTVEEIWWSEKHVNIVECLKQPKSRHQFDLCQNCYMMPRGQAPFKGEQIRQKIKTVLWKKGLISLDSKRLL